MKYTELNSHMPISEISFAAPYVAFHFKFKFNLKCFSNCTRRRIGDLSTYFISLNQNKIYLGSSNSCPWIVKRVPVFRGKASVERVTVTPPIKRGSSPQAQYFVENDIIDFFFFYLEIVLPKTMQVHGTSWNVISWNSPPPHFFKRDYFFENDRTPSLAAVYGE